MHIPFVPGQWFCLCTCKVSSIRVRMYWTVCSLEMWAIRFRKVFAHWAKTEKKAHMYFKNSALNLWRDSSSGKHNAKQCVWNRLVGIQFTASCDLTDTRTTQANTRAGAVLLVMDTGRKKKQKKQNRKLSHQQWLKKTCNFSKIAQLWNATKNFQDCTVNAKLAQCSAVQLLMKGDD